MNIDQAKRISGLVMQYNIDNQLLEYLRNGESEKVTSTINQLNKTKNNFINKSTEMIIDEIESDISSINDELSKYHTI